MWKKLEPALMPKIFKVGHVCEKKIPCSLTSWIHMQTIDIMQAAVTFFKATVEVTG